MNYLNLGCGHRFHPEWTNVDFVQTGENVIAYNLTQGIPFPDSSFDVIYHSHVLEHFPKVEAVSFLKDCYRALRPQGILRVVVPDLEEIARTYIVALEKSLLGSEKWAANYEWILLEMYDQMVRNHSGGEMASYLFKEVIPNEDFILKRCGLEVKKLIEFGHRKREQVERLSIIRGHARIVAKKVYRSLRHPIRLREALIKLILGNEYNALNIGRFRQSGEVHQWMYDRYSLGCLLKQCGFENIIQRSAMESYIPEWTGFDLDTEPDGSVYKPDSLYMEAIKPVI